MQRLPAVQVTVTVNYYTAWWEINSRRHTRS